MHGRHVPRTPAISMRDPCGRRENSFFVCSLIFDLVTHDEKSNEQKKAITAFTVLDVSCCPPKFDTRINTVVAVLCGATYYQMPRGPRIARS